MAFSFGGIHLNASKKSLNHELLKEIVLIDNTEYTNHEYYLILLDEFYSPTKIKMIKAFLKQNGIFNYRAVVAINCHVKKADITDGIIKFYTYNKSDWKQYAEGARAIITAGAALYSVTESDDLHHDNFRDLAFNKPYFWSPAVDKYIFPVDSFHDIFCPVTDSGRTSKITNGPADTYKTHFIEYVLKYLQKVRLVPINTPDPILKTISSKEEFLSVCKELEGSQLIAYDLETSGFDQILNRIGCLTMSVDGVTGYYVDWSYVDKPALNALLKSCPEHVGANLKFDIRFLWQNGIYEAKITHDTVQLGHLLNSYGYNGLKAHAFLYTRHGGYDKALDSYIAKTGCDDFTEIPVEILSQYATMDAIITYQVFKAQQRHLDTVDNLLPNEKCPEWPMRRYYEEIMMPAVRAFAEIEFRGVVVNMETLRESRQKFFDEIAEIEQQLTELWQLDPGFEFGSPKQLGLLFERLGWPDLGRSKSGEYKTNDELLEQWVVEGCEGANKIQRLRSLKTMLKSFLSTGDDATKGWARYIREHKEDNTFRMHPVYGVMRTETGRCRSSNPNMQNVPSHGDLAKSVKKVIQTPNNDEYFLSTVDYASLQMRIAAIDTTLNEKGHDVNLFSVYTDPELGGDMHSRTGYGVFAENREFDFDMIYVTQDGKEMEFFADEFVNTERGRVYAKDLVESDVLV